MLLVFTRARRDRDNHRRDLLTVCCAPDGAHVQFGYDKKWVPQALWDKIKLEKQPALIIYCENPDPNEWAKYRYHPLRFARVVNAQVLDASVNIMLELGAFVGVPGSGEYPVDRLEDFQTFVRSSVECPTPQPGATREAPNTRFIREEGKDPGIGRAGRWEVVADHCKTLEGLSDCSFCSLTYDSSLPKGIAHLPAPQFAGGQTAIDVASGRSYRLAVRIIRESGAPKSAPDLRMGETLGTTCGPFSMQWGKGEETAFVLTIQRSLESITSFVELKFRPEADGIIRAPEFRALLRARPPILAAIVAAALVVVGSFLLSADVAAVREILGCSESLDQAKVAARLAPWCIWVCARAHVVSNAVRAFGLVSVFAGTLVGFQKLPLNK